jgi:hypothetical protein
MTESIVAIRMSRNLRYKLTYVEIFKNYMEPDPGPQVIELLQSLIQAQQAAIAPLSRYLRRLDVNTQELGLNEKLLAHASARQDVKSRLRFIYDGLSRAVSWYKMQLLDRQMTSDPDLRQLLFELGETDAAQLWRTETTMAMLKIPVKLREKEWDEQSRPAPEEEEGWRPRLVEDVSRPSWSGRRTPDWSRPSYKDRKR